MFTYILYGIAIAWLIVSFVKDNKKVSEIPIKQWVSLTF